MSLPVSAAMRAALEQGVKKPQLIMEIEGLPTYSSIPVQKYPVYGDEIYYGDAGLLYGGLVTNEDILPWIDLSRSSNSIQQQLQPDKGGFSSVTNFDVCVIDKNGAVSALLKPTKTDDILSKKVKLYLGLEGAGHPQDSILFFTGIVTAAPIGAGFVKFNLSSPEKLKNLEIFPKISTALSADVHYNSAQIQDILYSKREDITENVSITYLSGGTKGSETVSVSGGDITIYIDTSGSSSSDLTTASNIKHALELNLEAANLIYLKINGDSSAVQTVNAQTFLTTTTTISVDSTSDFLDEADSGTLTTYLIIGDEIVKYTGRTSTTFTGCSRAQFGTVATTHSGGENVESAYRLQGNLKDLSLKLMLSGRGTTYLDDAEILGFNEYGISAVSNAIFLGDLNFKSNQGVVIGDTITISGAANAGNNGATTIIDIGQTELNSYLILDKTLITEGIGATFTLTSQFDVLPKFAGLEMTPDQVDVQEFLDKYSQFSASFFEYDFFLKDSVKGSEFINEQILFPSGCYSIPRKAKTSIGLTIPPLATAQVKTIDWSNVTNASSIVIDRSINQNFYNSIIFKYDPDQVTDKYKRGLIRQSADSTNRIKVANKALTIEADGVRDSVGFDSIINVQERRFLDRYQYCAESIDVEVTFGAGFEIEIGDAVVFKGEELKVGDSTQGSRVFRPRLFEVQNKTLRLSGQPIRLKLVDTAYNLNGRYGIISPSSKIDSGATTTNLPLKRSYGTLLGYAAEGAKWSPVLGVKVRVRSEDYTFDEETYLQSIDPANPSGIIVSPALSTPPNEDYVVDIAAYSASTDPLDEALSKALYCSWNNQITITSGTSGTVFDVGLSDAADLAVGYLIYVHSDDYTNQSAEVLITDITGTQITVDTDLGFTPASGDKIEVLNYIDGGYGYRFL